MSKVIGFPSQKGFPAPKRKWDQSCKWCKGTGFVAGLRGPEKCQGCGDEQDFDLDPNGWPFLIRNYIEDWFGGNVWECIKTNRYVQLRSGMIADWLMRCADHYPEETIRWNYLVEAIPLPEREARSIATMIFIRGSL
jgi:hypothetical protein